MAIPTEKPYEPIVPDAHDRALARAASRVLGSLLASGDDVGIRVLENGDEGPLVKLPASALHLLVGILTEMARGNTVTVIPQHTDLTTQQAADLLNISRPHLIKLLETGEIPFHKVGAHRRIRSLDVLAYKHEIDAAREETLKELASLSQELGLDDLDRE